MADMRPFLCKNKKHRLGVISWNGSGIPQLILYRHAVNLDADHPAEIDVLGKLTGVMPIRCDLCDEVTPWKISIDALLMLVEQLNDEQQDEFVEKLYRRQAKVAFE